MFGDDLVIDDNANPFRGGADGNHFAGVFGGHAVAVVVGANQAGATDANAVFDMDFEDTEGKAVVNATFADVVSDGRTRRDHSI